MSAQPRLVLFDVDGTLVDSQADIVQAMTAAFAACEMVAPDRAQILSIVGLSLDHAMMRLAPGQTVQAYMDMVEAYKQAYVDRRAQVGAAQSSPLYPGALATLRALAARPEIVLGVATGKSRRGLDMMIAGHDLGGMFVTRQVADDHPSKPHPAMIHTALAETGIDPDRAVMIGDTSFDMDMAQAAGVAGLGVSWGYHPVDALGAAHRVIDDFGDLMPTLDALWGGAR